MARNWKDVRKDLGPEGEARIKARVRDEIGRLSLNQLREARSLTQTSLAELLGIPQGGVSRLERRTDMYVSNLRRYIEALTNLGNALREEGQRSEALTAHQQAVELDPRRADSHTSLGYVQLESRRVPAPGDSAPRPWCRAWPG